MTSLAGKMDTRLQTAFVLVLSIFVFVKGDTPANCTYEDIRGDWMFKIGSRGHDRTLKCDSFGKCIIVRG
jgi:cathepsin C